MTGKNSIATHPIYGLDGRILLGVPYKNINDQMAREAHDDGDREQQIFSNSTINDTVLSFKKQSNEPLRVNYEESLKNVNLPLNEDLVIHTTYNQVLNLGHEILDSFEYIFIDESHALTSDISFRAGTISKLLYHLVEFVANYPESNTKIIFMSGTPNVETLIIPEILKQYEIDHLFQKIKVDKTYKTSPEINLVHLDTNDGDKREDARISEIKKYLNKEKKVVHILNNKEKMADMTRVIHEKINPKLKIGMFYSGSEGQCTDNILASKLGDYDVVLATNYFINGINITKDLGTEITENKQTSSQEYALVTDLGCLHSRINAIETIQAVNRFRNRKCEATVFFPKIFRQDAKNPNGGFHFGNAARVILGMNIYNNHLLSMDENTKPNKTQELEEPEERVIGLNQVLKNPLSISLSELHTISINEERKRDVRQLIEKEVRVYDDWYYSLDGFNYLCKDAGFIVNIKHKDVGEALNEATEDQVELNNAIEKNFIENSLKKLINKPEDVRKIYFQASGKIIDPKSTFVGNFYLKTIAGEKFIFEGDFHSSHQQRLNKLFRCILSICKFYDKEDVIESLISYVNGKISLRCFDEKSFLKNIVAYKNACFARRSDKYIEACNFILSLDELYSMNLGIEKYTNTFYNVYTIRDTNRVKQLRESWALQQYEMLRYKLKSLKQEKKVWTGDFSKTKKIKEKRDYFGNLLCKGYLTEAELDKYESRFSNEELIKQQNLERLDFQLNQIGIHQPHSYGRDGLLKEYETIRVPRIVKSQNLIRSVFLEDDTYVEPEVIEETDIADELDKFFKKTLRNLNINFDQPSRHNNPFVDSVYNYIKTKITQKDIQGVTSYIKNLIKDSSLKSTPGLLTALQKVQNDLYKVDQVFLTAFKSSEYMSYRNLTKGIESPFNNTIFFSKEGAKLEDSRSKPNINLEVLNIQDIYNSLSENSPLYVNAIVPRVHFKGKKITLKRSNPSALKYTDKAYVVLNSKNEILYADFRKNQACNFLCNYALVNEEFRLKNGIIPVKNKDRGIYNSITFEKDYYPKKSAHKTLENYSIEELNITVIDYLDYVKSVE